MKHTDHWMEIGHVDFTKLKIWEAESEVLRRLYNEHWGELNLKEQKHALRYVAREYIKANVALRTDIAAALAK